MQLGYFGVGKSTPNDVAIAKMAYVISNKIDLCAVTETWLTQNDDAVRAACQPEGYTFLDQERLAYRKGGGTTVFISIAMSIEKLTSGEKDSFEFSEWLVTKDNFALRLCIIYRPPYSEHHPVPVSVFLEEFSKYLEHLVTCKEPLLITGEFDIHVETSKDTCSAKFLDILESVGLKQHVNVPTHESGYTLDLIITRNCEDVVVDTPHATHFISDHAFVQCHLSCRRPMLEKKNFISRPKKDRSRPVQGRLKVVPFRVERFTK